jgi:peptidyl-prolyl cis-trans isomerase C
VPVNILTLERDKMRAIVAVFILFLLFLAGCEDTSLEPDVAVSDRPDDAISPVVVETEEAMADEAEEETETWEDAQAAEEVDEAETMVDEEAGEAETMVDEEAGEVETLVDEEAGEVRESDAVVATVNGSDIMESEVQAVIQRALRNLRGRVAPQLLEQYKGKMRKDAVERLIAERLLVEKIEQEDIKVGDEEVDEKLNQLAAQQNLTLDDLKALLQAYGKSFEELREQTQKGMAYEKLVEIKSAGKVNVTQQEAESYYKENEEKFKVPEQVKASHILINTEPTDPNGDPAEAKAEARAQAEKLLEQLKNGADFATLASQYSVCPSARKGGDLGYFPKGRMVAEFEKAAFGLDIGEVSEIVETQFGFHIIKVADRKEADVISFEEAKDDIIANLKQGKQEEFIEEYIEQLKDNATIVYSRPKDN